MRSAVHLALGLAIVAAAGPGAACGADVPDEPPPPPPPPPAGPCPPAEAPWGGEGALAHDVCVEIDDASWARLHADPLAEVEAEVVLWIDGRRFPGVELELHGGYARTVRKLSYRVKLPDPGGAPLDLFGDGPEAQRRLVLQAAWIDPTFLRNLLALELVRASGGLAPRVAFARVSFNGRWHGLYQAIERIDELYLARQGLEPTGNLYKAEGNEADWRAKPDPLSGFEHEIGAGRPVDDLRALLEAATSTPLTVEDFAARVEPLLDVEDVLRYQRVHTFAMNRDAYTKNYLLHHDLLAPAGTPGARFRLISWDADATFGEKWEGTDLPPDQRDWHGWDGFSPRLLGIPAYRDRYLEAYGEALDAELAADVIEARIDELAALVGAEAARDLAAWEREEDWEEVVARLRACVRAREATMREVLEDLR